MVNNYCQHEAGVRNLRKCIDRIFRKVVAKIEAKNLLELQAEAKTSTESSTDAQDNTTTTTAAAAPTGEQAATQDLSLFKEALPQRLIKEYQINTQNLETFLDVPMTDDNYYYGIVALPTDSPT